MRYLMYFKDGAIRKFPLERPAITIGRGAGNDIVLDDDSISKKHCRVEVSPDHIRVVDLKSRNGTFVDKATITEARLALNSWFGAGETEFFYGEGDAKEFQVSPELSGIIAALTRTKRNRPGDERETREFGTKYDHLLKALVEKAVIPADFDSFLTAARDDLGALLPSASLFLRCGERTWLLLDHLGLADSEAIAALGREGAPASGTLTDSGHRLYYRFIPSSGCPGAGGLLFLRGRELPGPADPLTGFLDGLRHVLDFKLNLAPAIDLAPKPDETVFAQGGITLVGRSPAMRKVADVARRIAPRDSFVLIMGESGTGKELLARMIHDLSGRRHYVAFNCAAIPEHLLESELFGYESGAFTDARKRKLGKIEEASGGTLVLDEVGDMPPAIQAKLLRVIQEQQVTRLGGNVLIPVDLRIISMTNQDLYHLVETGKFRQDLFFRLRVHELRVPPLRERREDIPALVIHFGRVHAEKTGVTPGGFSQSIQECFQNYPWPGNVRELENEVARIMEIIEDGELISDHHLLPSIAGQCRCARPPAAPAVPASLKEKLEETEREEIRRLLAENQGNKLRTARILQMSYQGFLKKLKRLNIES